jgi:hypothetical protein
MVLPPQGAKCMYGTPDSGNSRYGSLMSTCRKTQSQREEWASSQNPFGRPFKKTVLIVQNNSALTFIKKIELLWEAGLMSSNFLAEKGEIAIEDTASDKMQG